MCGFFGVFEVEVYAVFFGTQGRTLLESRMGSSLTSVPACRKSLRAEKYGMYFDFEPAKKSTYVDIF